MASAALHVVGSIGGSSSGGTAGPATATEWTALCDALATSDAAVVSRTLSTWETVPDERVRQLVVAPSLCRHLTSVWEALNRALRDTEDTRHVICKWLYDLHARDIVEARILIAGILPRLVWLFLVNDGSHSRHGERAEVDALLLAIHNARAARVGQPSSPLTSDAVFSPSLVLYPMASDLADARPSRLAGKTVSHRHPKKTAAAGGDAGSPEGSGVRDNLAVSTVLYVTALNSVTRAYVVESMLVELQHHLASGVLDVRSQYRLCALLGRMCSIGCPEVLYPPDAVLTPPHRLWENAAAEYASTQRDAQMELESRIKCAMAQTLGYCWRSASKVDEDSPAVRELRGNLAEVVSETFEVLKRRCEHDFDAEALLVAESVEVPVRLELGTASFVDV